MTATAQPIPEWRRWAPRSGTLEAEEWPEFMTWCDQWAKWTASTVFVGRGESETAPTLPTAQPGWHQGDFTPQAVPFHLSAEMGPQNGKGATYDKH